jgi:sugar lactone lactonase YvrE
MTSAPTLLVDGLAFAEAPRWHLGELWFSDFYTHQVKRVDAQGQVHTVVEVPMQPSGLGWTPDGRLLVVSMLDHRLLRLDPAGLVDVADLSAFAGGPCNDMVVSATGRAYIGNFGFDLLAKAPPVPTVLVAVEPDGRARVVAQDLMFPNGSVITPDGCTLVVAETFGQRLTAFDIAADGQLGGRRVWADLPGLSPDGICLDAEGAIWVASPRSKEFVRVHEGGHISQRVASGSLSAIACALGGADGCSLFMVSGKVQPAEAALAERCGRIEVMRVAVPGA